jgi:protein-L-isoaspartate(D-aspartate) O-methyltransferase
MLRPRDVAKLLQAVRPRPSESALAIAAPYAAEILGLMGLAVTHQTGADLTDVAGSWDVIVCEGAVAKAPAAWISALATGGRLGVVERDGPVGRATIYLRTEHSVGARPVFDCTPPMLAGFEPVRGFAL